MFLSLVFSETRGIRSEEASFASCPECATQLDHIVWFLCDDRIAEIGISWLHVSRFPRHTYVSKTLGEG